MRWLDADLQEATKKGASGAAAGAPGPGPGSEAAAAGNAMDVDAIVPEEAPVRAAAVAFVVEARSIVWMLHTTTE